MKTQTSNAAAAARLDRRTTACTDTFSYRRHVAAPRALFAAPPPDLLTLVIAEAVKRKAQAEIQRDVLRESLYEMPVSPERNGDRERGADIQPADFYE